MPESTAHEAATNRIRSILAAWAERVGNGARIARNLAVRWMPKHPSTGVDPDVCVLLPGPADFDELTSYKVWERPAPPLAFEVVSGSHPYKDYRAVHEGYAAIGVLELVIFDPQLLGPKALGGPVLLQLWRRDVVGTFERVHFGNDPVYSNVLQAWLSADGRDLVVSEDHAGKLRWPTELEQKTGQLEARAAQAQSEAQRAHSEAQRALSEAAQLAAEKAAVERRLAELLAERDVRWPPKLPPEE